MRNTLCKSDELAVCHTSEQDYDCLPGKKLVRLTSVLPIVLKFATR